VYNTFWFDAVLLRNSTHMAWLYCTVTRWVHARFMRLVLLCYPETSFQHFLAAPQLRAAP
jgi:hypothetical protein